MVNTQHHKPHAFQRRRARVRQKVHGTALRPRLSVYRSLKHLSVQLIDDQAHATLVSARDTELSGGAQKSTPTERARAVGKLVAERAAKKQITTVVFDRGARPYHGRVQAVAEGAREGGLTV